MSGRLDTSHGDRCETWLGELQALSGSLTGIDEPSLQGEIDEEASVNALDHSRVSMRRQRSIQDGVYGEGEEELAVADPAEMGELTKAAGGLESRLVVRTTIASSTDMRQHLVNPIRLAEAQYECLFAVLGEQARDSAAGGSTSSSIGIGIGSGSVLGAEGSMPLPLPPRVLKRVWCVLQDLPTSRRINAALDDPTEEAWATAVPGCSWRALYGLQAINGRLWG